jgi:hypothetical protein
MFHQSHSPDFVVGVIQWIRLLHVADELKRSAHYTNHDPDWLPSIPGKRDENRT